MHLHIVLVLIVYIYIKLHFYASLIINFKQFLKSCPVAYCMCSYHKDHIRAIYISFDHGAMITYTNSLSIHPLIDFRTS